MMLLVALSMSGSAGPAPAGAPVPGPREKCPVCGMFVAKYPDWTAAVTFRDGTTRFFDGAKDLFRYLLRPARYGSRQGMKEAAEVYVKDYYNLEQFDGRQAFYVVGSDVLGPMGKELIPFARREDAEEFLRDHRGARIVTFGEVTAGLLATLD